MDRSDKLSRFEEAFERGQRGRISSREAWLEELGFSSGSVREDFVREYFGRYPQEAPGHEEQLEEIAEFAGYFSTHEGPYHFSVVGVSGIGKSLLFTTLAQLFEKLDTRIEIRSYDADDLSSLGEEELYIHEVTDELDTLEKSIIFVDNCGSDPNIAHSLASVADHGEDVFIVSAWTPEMWSLDGNDVAEEALVTKQIELNPLNEQGTVQALEIIMDAMTEGNVTLPHEVLRRIYEVTRGVPRLFIKMLVTTINETYTKELEFGDPEAVVAAADRLGMTDAQERVHDISEQRLTMLKHILLCRDERGMQPTKLVDKMHRDKSTISYHLQELSSTGMVEFDKEGRSTFYRVKEALEPFIQMRIAKEGEIHEYA